MADSVLDWVNGVQSVAENQTSPVTQGEPGRNPQLVEAFPFPPPYQNGPPASADSPSVAQGTSAVLFGNASSVTNPPAPRTLAGTASRLDSFSEAIYERIHVIPRISNLGNVLQGTQVAIEVWNAFETAQTLSQISGGQAGTSILAPTPPGSTPADFLPRASFVYVADVDTDGPTQIDSVFTFDFTVESPTYTLTGTRTVLLPFPAQRPVNEALEWKTDIIESRNGKEQRIRTRILPRNLYEMDILEPRPVARTALLNRIWGFHGRSFGVPLWPFGRPLLQDAAVSDSTISVDTTNADFRDSTADTPELILLWRDFDDFEVAQIAVGGLSAGSITLERPLEQSHAAGATEVLPIQIMLGKAVLDWSRTPNGMLSFQGSWIAERVVDRTLSDSELTFLDGLPVFEGLNFTSEMEESFDAKYDLIDFETGLFRAEPRRLIGELSTQKGFETDTDADSWRLRQLLYAMRGRQRSFWLPTWQEEFDVVQPIGAADLGITVTNAGHARFLDAAEPFSAIMFVLVDGTQFFRRITGITDNLDGTETVAINSSLGQAVAPQDLERVSYMVRSRFGSDRIEIEHRRKGVLRVNTPVIGVIQ